MPCVVTVTSDLKLQSIPESKCLTQASRVTRMTDPNRRRKNVPSLTVWQLQLAAERCPLFSSLCQRPPGAYCSSSPSSSLCGPSRVHHGLVCPETWCAASLVEEAPAQNWIIIIIIMIKTIHQLKQNVLICISRLMPENMWEYSFINSNQFQRSTQICCMHVFYVHSD